MITEADILKWAGASALVHYEDCIKVSNLSEAGLVIGDGEGYWSEPLNCFTLLISATVYTSHRRAHRVMQTLKVGTIQRLLMPLYEAKRRELQSMKDTQYAAMGRYADELRHLKEGTNP